jgi:hypothetical protein
MGIYPLRVVVHRVHNARRKKPVRKISKELEQRIHDYVQQNPYVPHGEVAELLGVSRSTVIRTCRDLKRGKGWRRGRRAHPKDEEEFWSRLDRSAGRLSCWPGTGRPNNVGYVHTSWKGKNEGVHRIAWKLANKREIPTGYQIHHQCGNRACANPSHLELIEPIEHMIRTGILAPGSASPKGRLSLTKLGMRGIDTVDLEPTALPHIKRSSINAPFDNSKTPVSMQGSTKKHAETNKRAPADAANAVCAGTFLPVPSALFRKPESPFHIVVGNDESQIGFLSQALGREVQPVDRATDDLLAGRENVLLHVCVADRICLSHEALDRAIIWSADPIVDGSDALKTIVRYAATLISGAESILDQQTLKRVGAKVLAGPTNHIAQMVESAKDYVASLVPDVDTADVDDLYAFSVED